MCRTSAAVEFVVLHSVSLHCTAQQKQHIGLLSFCPFCPFVLYSVSLNCTTQQKQYIGLLSFCPFCPFVLHSVSLHCTTQQKQFIGLLSFCPSQYQLELHYTAKALHTTLQKQKQQQQRQMYKAEETGCVNDGRAAEGYLTSIKLRYV